MVKRGYNPNELFHFLTWFIVSWGNFRHLRALFLFWPSNGFGMGFGRPRS